MDYAAVLLPEIGVVSLRSRKGGVNVAAIAKEHDDAGGGHVSAAGFPLAELLTGVYDVALARLTGKQTTDAL